MSQLEQIGDNDSPYENRHMEQENQLNSTEECDEMVKDVILTEKVSKTIITLNFHNQILFSELNVNVT